MKLNWLDRVSYLLPVYFTVASSQAIIDRELKRMKVRAQVGVDPGAGATTTFLVNNEGKLCAIVCLFDHKKIEKKQLYALLVHEAVHIFQEAMCKMGEKTPGQEFMAYTIQKISQDLFYEFDRQIGAKK